VGFSKRKFNVGAVIHLPVPASLGELSISADYAWKSRLFAGIATDMPDPRSWRPPMGYLNLGAQWNDILRNKHLQASLAVTNVNNEALGAGHSQLVDIGGVQAYEIHTPRMYSLRLQYSF
jgi:outer membrane receptor protein involved in Fe transport